MSDFPFVIWIDNREKIISGEPIDGYMTKTFRTKEEWIEFVLMCSRKGYRIT